ncbi:putative sensor domain DACNV-containing protein [Rubripirellula lacrimiformis]|uniref:putative sensor domain DACNV-containing protein n=1 Tax=Rubripirellula lacrimiformis TaxID=1930273 RepID=UPI001FE95679|nr:diadenylate cyclase [Rubripirellula lacrimiformis]
MSAYPIDIATALRERWISRDHPLDALPDHNVVVTLLDTMYQASLLREEKSAVQCRIVFVSQDVFQREAADGSSPLHVLRFDEPAPYTAHNLRKLAAAAGYYRALLAVYRDPSGQLSVWGMIVTGTEWVNHLEGGRLPAAPLPDKLVIQALSPGHIVATCGYTRILESNTGQLLKDGFDPFLSKWLPQRFVAIRESLLDEMGDHAAQGTGCQVCDDFVKDLAQRLVRRVLRLVRMRGHGGMLVYLPENACDQGIPDEWFRFRVRFQPDDSTFRFRRLMLKLMKRAAEIGRVRGLAVVTLNDYLQMLDADLASIDEALIEFSHLLADLMNVDGSLVLDRSFRLIGFGGEILGNSHVSSIHRALDLEAAKTISERADSSGTRHRSAYRLVNGINDAIAVVVSQDGDVRFVACLNQKLTYWPYLP